VPEQTLSAQEDLTDVWRDAAEASFRYWGRLGRLTFESVAALVPLVTELRAVEQASPASAEIARDAPTIVVEAEAGQAGVGVFLLENTTADQVSVPIVISPFRDAAGQELRPTVAFRPETILLDPGDQLVVQVAVAVDETLEPEVRYRAEISVPGLSRTRVPIVVRRRASAAPKKQAKTKTRAS
jgi:hypothetical protein